MKKQDVWLRIAAGLMIGFLAIYSGCLIWSGVQGRQIPWAEEVRSYVIRTCMKVSVPTLAATGSPEKSWQEQGCELLANVLNWPFVLPQSDAADMQTLLPVPKEIAMPEVPAGKSDPERSVREEGMDETVPTETESETESSPAETPETSADEVTGGTESQPAAPQEPPETEGQAVTAAAQPAFPLLPIEGQVRPEIQALPPINQLSYEQFFDYGYLLNRMYVVNGGCNVNEEILNPRRLLCKNLTISHDGEDYQILIYHTHSQEAFADSVPGEVSHTVVGLGNYLTQLLEERGYRVLHVTGIYDMENGVLERDHAYDRALPMLEQTLAEHPGIQAVIDLHRDGVAEDVHLVTDVDGRQTARLMFFNGMCRDDNGERTDVTNPYREDCLAFSLQSALQLEAYYPGMLRVVYLKQSRYNQHLCGRSMLAEVGAQTNTVEEAYNAIPVLADVIARVLQ